MKKYLYEAVILDIKLTGKTEDDYLKVINERAEKGWRFVCFKPVHIRTKGVKSHAELIFEKEVME